MSQANRIKVATVAAIVASSDAVRASAHPTDCGFSRKLMAAMPSIYGSFARQMLAADGAAIELYQAMGFERAGIEKPMWVYTGVEY